MYAMKDFFSNFNPMNFVSNLKYLVVGMISIFIVIAVIMIVTILLNKFFKEKK